MCVPVAVYVFDVILNTKNNLPGTVFILHFIFSRRVE